MSRWWVLLLALGGAVLLAACHGGPHLELTVTTTADGPDADPGDGVCEMTSGLGDCSLRAAIDEVNAQPADLIGDIELPAGTYVLTGAADDNTNATGDLDLRRWVNVVGTGEVVVDGGGVDRVFDVRPGATITTENLTITGGSVVGNGGGLRSNGNVGFLANTTIEGNAATSKGGGIYTGAASQLTLNNVTVSGNSAALGGGVGSLATIRTDSVTITANWGGGIYDGTGGVTVRTTIVGDQQSGHDCAGVAPVSGGFNLDSDGTCALTEPGDVSGQSAELEALADNGGTTATHLPALGSPAIDAVPLSDLSCNGAIDQRGQARPSGYGCDIGSVESLSDGFVDVSTVLTTDRAWDLGFTPDGTMLYTQRAGQIMAFDGSDSTQLAAPDDVVAVGEGGMLGIAVDPEFTTNRYIYTCFNSDLGPVPEVRIVRWTVDAGYTGLTDRTDILTGITVNPGNQPGRHSGCRTRFGPDGYLWITTGDGAVGTNPQDPNSLAGKVLRIDRDGDPAPGNPGAPLRPEIYTYGHRNPQGITFRPSDGAAFSIEHGSNCDDEVNRLVPGGNYGWNPVRPNGQPGYFEGVPMTDTEEFPAAIEAVWSSGCPTIAPSGGTFVSGAEWGALDGTLAMAVLKGMHLRMLEIDPLTDDVLSQIGLVNGEGRLRVAVQGPDGSLYLVVDANPGAILRVTPAEG